ncbi:raffinose/stachyose/melibiose transport system substrate-binding protein [Aequitasia blattaphilus]|uniref:ABC transporter substrate-binding protein n=1 Tax=Aequitasia blattaphilus TaxID=2949332 RepID=A0ABT1E9H0_9FIRM|nr:ABC transporter substrate-binding protein [Aequitasia blattaphilus]MCP1102479.1 ABC transporter substrate-binding protein [Aequitasia blattaphilus]MCR8615119.1 ABC transporter substrate-binding protein [Aequitasia blattaphilus]
MKKKIVSLLLVGTLLLSMTACGGKKEEGGSGSGGKKTTITFAIWDNNLNDFIEQEDMVGKFQEEYPDIDVEVEKLKDDSEYWNAMKMRSSANELPDVMFNKTFTLSRFKDYLVDLSDTEAAKNNELAEGYGIDGKILGVPMTAGYEYVYYWKDMFEEAGVEVPTTWPQFMEAAQKLQDYYGKDNPDFMGLAIGLKDTWTDYPFMEFMPSLESGNGQNWNTMATEDEPFKEGTDVYNAFKKVDELFSSSSLGKDPLGLGNDQVTSLFAAKKGGMIALGDWGLQNIETNAGDISQLGSFYLPARNTESDPFNVIVQGDSFMGVTTHSKNQEAAIKFVEWFYSDAWYPDYLDYITSASAMTTFPKEKHEVLQEADELAEDANFVMYDGGGDDFQALQNETTFDYKNLGAQMATKDFDLDKALSELNTSWKAAREKLEIK